MAPSETYRKVDADINGYVNNGYKDTEPPIITVTNMDLEPKKDFKPELPKDLPKKKINKYFLDP